MMKKMTEKLIFNRAYPLFGEANTTNGHLTMTLLLELSGGDFTVWNDCDWERDDLKGAMEWAIKLFSFSPLAQFIETPDDVEIGESLAIDLLWINEDGDLTTVQCDDNGRYVVGGVDFATREEAVHFAVHQLLPIVVYAANDELIERFPQVENVLKEW